MEFGGIILAGGESRRMGKDKGLILYKNRPLVRYAIESIKPYCEDLIISSNNPEYERFGYPVVSDVVKNVGPIGGLVSILPQAKQDYNLVVSTDMPFINHEAIELLIHSVSGAQSYISQHSGMVEPLFGIYHKSAAAVFKTLVDGGEYQMKSALMRIDTKYINFNSLLIDHPYLFNNFNKPSDLK